MQLSKIRRGIRTDSSNIFSHNVSYIQIYSLFWDKWRQMVKFKGTVTKHLRKYLEACKLCLHQNIQRYFLFSVQLLSNIDRSQKLTEGAYICPLQTQPWTY